MNILDGDLITDIIIPNYDTDDDELSSEILIKKTALEKNIYYLGYFAFN